MNEKEAIKNEYEAKLSKANERFRVTKAENVELKERNEVLYKLGRSNINFFEEKN